MGHSVKRIALSGVIRGGALLKEKEGATEAEFALRGLPAGAYAIAYGLGGLVSAPISGGRALIPATGVCALGVAIEGRLVSRGFTGSCAERPDKLLPLMRLRAAELSPPPPEKTLSGPALPERPPVPPAPAPRGPASPAAAQALPAPPDANADITREILSRARMLFGGLFPPPAAGPAPQPRAQKPAPEPAPQPRPEKGAGESAPQNAPQKPSPDPFPKAFPGAEWHEENGVLRAQVRLNGRDRTVIAMPLGPRSGPMRPMPKGRVLVSSDGRRYLVRVIG